MPAIEISAMNEMNALRPSPCGRACSAGRRRVRRVTRGVASAALVGKRRAIIAC
jgi:hypothetical protein